MSPDWTIRFDRAGGKRRAWRRSALALAVSLGAAAPLSAQTSSWTLTTGTGAWTTPGNWAGNIVASGASNRADFASVNFSGSVNITLSAPQTIGNLTFHDTTTSSAASWTLSGSGPLTLVSSSTPVVRVTSNVAAGTVLTLSVPRAGTQGVIYRAEGAATSAAAIDVGTSTSTYTGVTTLGGGRLRLSRLTDGGVAGPLGAAGPSSANLVFDGGTLDYTGTTTSASDRAFRINAGRTAVFNVSSASGSLSLAASPFTTTGALLKSGPGTLTLTGSLAHTGSTTVSGGTLAMNGTHAPAGAYHVTGSFTGAATLGAAMTLAGGFGSALTVGPGAGSTAGIGTLTTNSLTVNGNYALRFDVTSNPTPGGTANDLLVVNGNLTLAGINTLELNAVTPMALSMDRPYGLIRFTGNLVGDLGNVGLVGAPSNTRPTVSLDVGSVPDAPAGNYIRVSLSGTAPAALRWNGGTSGLSAGDWDFASPHWQRVSTRDDFFYDLDAVSFDDTSSRRTVTAVGSLLPGSVTVTTTGGYVLSGPGSVRSAGTLLKAGAGTLALSPAGGVHFGVLRVDAGVLDVAPGGGAITAGQAVITGTLRFSRTDVVTFAAPTSGPGTLEQSGTGTLRLAAGSNTYSGPTLITAGTLVASAPGAIPANSAIVNGAQLVFEASQSLADVSGAGTTTVSGGVVASVRSIRQGTLALGTDAVLSLRVGGASVASELSVITSPGGLLDLTDKPLVVRGGGTSLAALRALVAAWTVDPTTGIGSSLASPGAAPFTTVAVFPNAPTGFAVPTFTTYAGSGPLTASDVILRYTYTGDTDLNGLLDARDFNTVVAGVSNQLTGPQASWRTGDLDHDGLVGPADLTLFLQAYAHFSANGLPPLALDPGDGAAVPEPGVALLAPAAVPLLSRRRSGPPPRARRRA